MLPKPQNNTLDVARRFFELLTNQALPAADFVEDDVWMNVPTVLSFATGGRALPEGCRSLLGELSTAMGLKPAATETAIGAAIERSFGVCPFGNEALVQLARYIHEQRNGTFEVSNKPKGPSIKGEF